MDNSRTTRTTSEYGGLSSEEVLRLLGSTAAGLTSPEAQRRQAALGFNEVVERKAHPLAVFLQRYWGPMPWLLEIAAALSVVLQHYIEATIILALLTTNTIVGHMQSRGSQRALLALKSRLAINARALRDSSWAAIKARELVPGDVVAIGLGDIVPADAKILTGSLSVDQSMMTGESLPADTEESGLVFAGSVVKRGEATAVVVNTGVNTYSGTTVEMVGIAGPASHQEQIMLAIVRYMMLLGATALAFVALYAAVTGAGILTIATLAAVFLIGAVPVALPAVMTIVQAVGATELAGKGVLVTRLDSIEDAASVDVLCLDKTGTITLNQLSVGDVLPFGEYSRDDVTLMARLASREESKDAIDLAIIDYARSTGSDLSRYEQLSFTPFEPSTRRSEATVSSGDRRFKVLKGAPRTVLSLCAGIEESQAIRANEIVEELSLKGYRTLGVAMSPTDSDADAQFVGLLSLSDPLRPDSAAMIQAARALGVKPMMLTGDNAAIARETARRASIGDRIVRMEELRGLDETEQTRVIEASDGVAEVYPEDKFRIVRLLQSTGHMVAMTGDGVNDAPSLKQAEMGIAVSSSTDVARASASMVLTQPGTRVIVDAITTSRHIYQRMLTWVINKVTKVIQVVGLLTVGFFWFHDTVVSLLGMALLVFANDFVTMSLATDNVGYTTSPNKWNIRSITLASLVVGVLLVAEGALALLAGRRLFHLDWDQMQTLALLILISSSQFRVLIVRERRHFWSSCPGRGLLIATAATIVAASFLAAGGFGIAALTPHQVASAVAFTAVFTLAIDFPKALAFRRFAL